MVALNNVYNARITFKRDNWYANTHIALLRSEVSGWPSGPRRCATSFPGSLILTPGEGCCRPGALRFKNKSVSSKKGLTLTWQWPRTQEDRMRYLISGIFEELVNNYSIRACWI